VRRADSHTIRIGRAGLGLERGNAEGPVARALAANGSDSGYGQAPDVMSADGPAFL
jgi:hypothetical protein